eukprot:UN09799
MVKSFISYKPQDTLFQIYARTILLFCLSRI